MAISEKEMEFEFLCRSIADKQATIRALDVKCGFLLVIVFAPLANLKKIYEVYQYVTGLSCLFYVLTSLVALAWILSVWTLFTCVSAIANPADKVSGDLPKGTFYSGGLYKLGFISNFFNFGKKSAKSLDQYLAMTPKSTEAILRELVFDNMKLAYIRDIKSKRASFCFKLVLFWMLIGLSLWAVYLGTGG